MGYNHKRKSPKYILQQTWFFFTKFNIWDIVARVVFVKLTLEPHNKNFIKALFCATDKNVSHLARGFIADHSWNMTQGVTVSSTR